MNNKAIVYQPAGIARENLLVLWQKIFKETIDSRWLIFYLMKRNFSAAYRQSVSGLFWALIVPLVSVGMFIFLNGSGVLNVGNISVPYPLYAVAGISLWQVFSIGITFGANALSGAGGDLLQDNVVNAVTIEVIDDNNLKYRNTLGVGMLYLPGEWTLDN